MAKEILFISMCAIWLGTGKLSAQYWAPLEQDEGACFVDSLVVVNSQYYSLLDTVEYYWSKCEFENIPCVASVDFLDTNHIMVTVMQVVDISPLVLSCYMDKIYGIICYNSHQYFFCSTYKWMIDRNSLQKSASECHPSFFSAKVFRDLTTNTNYLVKKTNQGMVFSYPISPFDIEEATVEKYDQLRLEILLDDDKIICNVKESCILSSPPFKSND